MALGTLRCCCLNPVELEHNSVPKPRPATTQRSLQAQGPDEQVRTDGMRIVDEVSDPIEDQRAYKAMGEARQPVRRRPRVGAYSRRGRSMLGIGTDSRTCRMNQNWPAGFEFPID